RTGRAGAKGRAFTFVAEDDGEAISNVEKLTGAKIKVFGKEDVRVELAAPGAQPDREAEPADEAPEPRKARRAKAEPRADEERPSKPRRARSRDEDGESAKAPAPRKSRHRSEDDEPVPPGEWNGPKPGFLDIGFG
ncbi:MAG: DEAD/DEAH box helicase, partial [Erythrobacter sp.]|nr:DEAD/DEAH box helicase [Erythrobacter sp.]